MANKERVDVYTIPPNFAKEGTILSGRVEARNAVEAAVLVLFLLQILMAVDLSVKGRIYAGIIVILPVAILAVVGVQGESLTSFIFQLFSYLTKRRVLTVPDGEYRLKRNRRLNRQQKRHHRMERRETKRKGGGAHRKRSKRTETKAKRSKAGRKGREKRTSQESQGTEKAGRGADKDGGTDTT